MSDLFPERIETERLGLELVAVPVQDGNERSRPAVERYVNEHDGGYDGIVRNAMRRPDGEIIDHHRYTITRSQYRSSSCRTPSTDSIK